MAIRCNNRHLCWINALYHHPHQPAIKTDSCPFHRKLPNSNIIMDSDLVYHHPDHWEQTDDSLLNFELEPKMRPIPRLNPHLPSRAKDVIRAGKSFQADTQCRANDVTVELFPPFHIYKLNKIQLYGNCTATVIQIQCTKGGGDNQQIRFLSLGSNLPSQIWIRMSHSVTWPLHASIFLQT